MRLIPGVDPELLHPALLLALVIGDECYKSVGSELIVTHLREGKHSATSLHYRGRAADCRTKHLDKTLVPRVLALWKDKLADGGKLYDLLWEDAGTENQHLHIEYDPKIEPAPQEPTNGPKPTVTTKLVRPTR